MAPAKGRTWSHTLELIGLRFRWKKDARRVLANMIENKGAVTGIRFSREPENKYDENAIAVYLPSRLMSGHQLGYLHRETAAMLAPKLDDGSLVIVSAELQSLNPRDDYNTGEILVRFKDVEKPRKQAKSKAV
jgi:HIRAN domain-containing protein